MELEDPRSPTDAEREVLLLLVSPTYPGVEAFRKQIATAMVQTDCTCGCGSFAIIPDPSAAVAVDHEHLTPAAFDGEEGVDMFMFAKEGRLTAVEITYFASESKGVPEDLSKFSFD